MDFTLTKEQEDIQKAAREFALGEFPDRAQEFDRNETLDLDIWRKGCELGFVGAFIPEEYGGAGLGYFENCLIMEEFWAVDAGMANSVLTGSFGTELLCMFGTEEQKEKHLPPVVEGKAMTGMAATEPVETAKGINSAGMVSPCDPIEPPEMISRAVSDVTSGGSTSVK